MHTAIGSLRLRSRGAHCEGTLRSGAGQTRSAKQRARKEARRKEEDEAAEAEAEAEAEQL